MINIKEDMYKPKEVNIEKLKAYLKKQEEVKNEEKDK